MKSSRPSSSMRLRSSLAALAFTGLMLGSGVTQANTTAAAPGVVITAPNADGVIRLRSMHGVDETVARIRAAVASKGVRFFDTIDQAQLGADAKLPIRSSTLVLFGNPPLGVQFLQANPYSGLDWPVRMLVIEDADGSVWLAWTDFNYIARRYHITNRAAQFKMASEVAGAIASDAAK
jgi:uncharacterized protein (DUF302 family)